MTFLRVILNDKIRLAKTSLLYSSFLIIGLVHSVIGPTLLDVRQVVNANAIEISAIFPVGSVGYMLGSVVGGLIYNRFNANLTFAFLCGLMSVCEAIVPWNRSLIPLCVTQFVMMMGAGGVDATGNVWLISMWKKDSAPLMQALHFMFGLGSFVGPLIAVPFLVNTEESPNVTMLTTVFEDDQEFLLWYPYTINAVIGLVTAAGLVVMYFVDNTEEQKQTEEREASTQIPLLKKCLILAIIWNIFHIYVGVEMSFGRFITSFAFFSDLHLNKSIGAYMTSVYWGTYTFFRLLTAFVVSFVGNKIVIFVCLFIVLFSNVLLTILGNSSETVLWIGVSLTGLGASSIFATLFTFTEELTPVTTRIASFFTIAVALGEFTVPMAVGSYVESYPMSMFYITTGSSIACLIFFIGLCIITKDITKYKQTSVTEQN